MLNKNQKCGYLFVLPIVFLFLVFIIYPIFYNGYISLFDWNGVSKTKDWNGIQNYIKLLQDPTMLKSLKNVIMIGAATVSIQCALGLIFASMLIKEFAGARIYRTIFYLPVIATSSIVASVFQKIFETNRGDLNTILRLLG